MWTELTMTTIISAIFATVVVCWRRRKHEKMSTVESIDVVVEMAKHEETPKVGSLDVEMAVSTADPSAIANLPILIPAIPHVVRPQRATLDQLRDYYARVPTIYAEEVANGHADEVEWMQTSGLLRAAQSYAH